MIYVCDADGRVSCSKTTTLTLKELCRLARAYKVKLPKRVNRKEDIYEAVAKAGKLPRFIAKAKEIDEQSASESDSDSEDSDDSSSESGSESGSSSSGSSSASGSSSGSSGSSSGSSATSDDDEGSESDDDEGSESDSSSSAAKHKDKKARTEKKRKPKTSTEDMTRMRAACATAGLSTSGGADCLRSRLLAFASSA